MSEKTPAVKAAAVEPVPAAVVGAPIRRHPGHRGADVRDTVAEMAAKAQEISMEAGSKMAAAMKDVLNAAPRLTSFPIDSSRALLHHTPGPTLKCLPTPGPPAPAVAHVIHQPEPVAKKPAPKVSGGKPKPAAKKAVAAKKKPARPKKPAPRKKPAAKKKPATKK